MTWREDAIEAVRDDPAAIRRLFPAVSRKVGNERGTDDKVRADLIAALGEHRNAELPDLYRFGDANERRAILLSAHHQVDDVLLALARNAIRSNDPRLVVSASRPEVVAHFGDGEVDQALMKCVFMDIPLADVPGLVQRVRPATSRMVAAFVLERVTAGRSVPADVWSVIDQHTPAEEVQQIEALVSSPVAERSEAARVALAHRTTTPERTGD